MLSRFNKEVPWLRYHISVWNRRKSNYQFKKSTLSTIPENLSAIDVEKEMFVKKRQMTAYHNKGQYEEALKCALDLESTVSSLMGTQNAVYASSLNNVALMYKLLGNTQFAMDKYTAALHVYEDVLNSKKTASYASTLANIGALYKGMAETSKGMEQLLLLERAEEALSDSYQIRKEVLGETNKETMFSLIHLSSVKKLKGNISEAEEILRKLLETAISTFTEMDTITAVIRNNLGILMKKNGKSEEAKEHYLKALHIRSKILGDTHPDTIVSMHNLAELHLSCDNVMEATKMQEKILSLANDMKLNTEEIYSNIMESSNKAIENKDQRHDDTKSNINEKLLIKNEPKIVDDFPNDEPIIQRKPNELEEKLKEKSKKKFRDFQPFTRHKNKAASS